MLDGQVVERADDEREAAAGEQPAEQRSADVADAADANWGSTAADPRDGSFYVVTKNLPTVLQLERIVPGVFGTGTSAGWERTRP